MRTTNRRPVLERHPSHPRSRRSGYSLIELMVVVSIFSLLFGMVGIVFHHLFQSEQLAMRAALSERSISRLAVRFRSDVHAATVARPEVVTESSRTITFPHRAVNRDGDLPAIVYTARKGEVVREQFDADGKRLNGEVYRLPECRVSFPDLPENAEGRLIGLVIERQGSTITPQPQATRPYRSLVIEAVLARDQHLAMGHLVLPPEQQPEESQ